MENSYAIKVNKNFDFQMSEQDIATLDVVASGKNELHLLRNGVSHTVHIVKSDFHNREYTLKINGTSYVVSIGTPLDVLIDKMGFADNTVNSVSEIIAPMPGLILDILVKEGDEVSENDQLLILEAMKMENSITSPRDGIIKKITVKKGDTVDKKQLLIEFQ